MIEDISAFEFICIPFDRNFPIRSCILTIYAKNREEAELIKLKYDYQFFNQDSIVSVKEFGGGYRKIFEPEEKS